MKFSKSDFIDILIYDDNTLKELNSQLYEKKQELLKEIADRITENNHVEVNFIAEE